MQKASFLLIGLFGIAGPVQAALPAPTELVVWRVFADEHRSLVAPFLLPWRYEGDRRCQAAGNPFT